MVHFEGQAPETATSTRSGRRRPRPTAGDRGREGRRRCRRARFHQRRKAQRTNVPTSSPSASRRSQCWPTRPSTRATSPRGRRRQAQLFDVRHPSVAYTDPAVAWVGVPRTRPRPPASVARAPSPGGQRALPSLPRRGHDQAPVRRGDPPPHRRRRRRPNAGELTRTPLVEMGPTPPTSPHSPTPPDPSRDRRPAAEAFEGTITDLTSQAAQVAMATVAGSGGA